MKAETRTPAQTLFYKRLDIAEKKKDYAEFLRLCKAEYKRINES